SERALRTSAMAILARSVVSCSAERDSISYWALEGRLTVSTIDPKELTVDVKTRTVRHGSGAEVKLPLGSRVVIHNGELFSGPDAELVEAAKRAAIAAGMGV